jgi:hypothetical protein
VIDEPIKPWRAEEPSEPSFEYDPDAEDEGETVLSGRGGARKS